MMDAEHRDQVRQLRSRKTQLFIVCLSSLLAVATYVRLHGDHPAVVYLIFTWIAIYAFVVLRLAFSRCPRCNYLFFARPGHVNPLANTCFRCELSLKVIPGESER